MTGHVAHARETVDASPDAVWAALVDPARISEWMVGTQVDTTWEVGDPITWRGELDGRRYEDKGEVLEIDPGRRLSMTHYSPLMGAEDRPENYHTVTYQLVADDPDGPTDVLLDQDGNETEEQARQFAGTWQQMLKALKESVEHR